MGRRDVDDFPFGYLADDRSQDRMNKSESGTRVRDDRPRRSSGSREIEKLLIIAVVLTILFVVLLTAAIVVGANKKKAAKVESSGTTTFKQTVDGQQSYAVDSSGTTGPTVQIIDVTDPTQLAVVQIG